MTIVDRPTRSPLHGRRLGRPLPAYQRELIDTLLPRLAVDLSCPVDPVALFGPYRDLWLEIGFGAGEHLVSCAKAHPDVALIGCEPFLNGLARALADIAAEPLDKVRLHGGDAGALVDNLPDASLGRVFLFYPDPWPKRRQHKRRFVSDEMLVRLARAMRPGAELRYATDIDDYCGWTLTRLLRSAEFEWTPTCADDWRRPWPNWISTRYERKAIAQGRRPCYLTAIRR